MSFVSATPEHVASAATELANIGSTISSANSAALGPTSTVLAAGADEVSASVAALFTAHAQAYEALSAQAALFHQQFVQLMSGGAAQYASAEATNAQQAAVNALGGPSLDPTGSSLIGSAAPAGSVAAAVPAAMAGPAGGSAPAAPAGHLVTAVSPAPAAMAPASTPVAAGSAALAPASTPVAAMQAATPAYSPATAATAGSAAPAPASTPAAAVEAETSEFSPATAVPAPVGTPVAAAPTATPNYSPATPAYSPATAGPAGSAKEHPAVTPVTPAPGASGTT